MDIFDSTYSLLPFASRSLVPTDSDVRSIMSRDVYRVWEHIPPEIRRLLYLSTDMPESFDIGPNIRIRVDYQQRTVSASQGYRDDPSTIYIGQPLSPPSGSHQVPSPGYFPSYAKLTQKQKYVYLCWLRDVSSPVNIGYVFVFYYGLERHLLLGLFDEAFDAILMLRRYHHNGSFQHYSFNGLAYGAIYRNRPDRLADLSACLNDKVWGTIQLMICARTGRALNSSDLTRVVRGLHDVDHTYTRAPHKTYLRALTEILERKYGCGQIDLNNTFPINTIQRHKQVIFANHAFPDEIRNADIPDFMRDSAFLSSIADLHRQAHELTRLWSIANTRGRQEKTTT